MVLVYNIVLGWELTTGFDTEETAYTGLFSRDVNNYLAIKPDGNVKTKGIFSPPAISKNPNNYICVEAVLARIMKGIPLETTIKSCRDIRKFVTIRTVQGGSVKNGTYLGKVVRWYYSVLAEGVIQYKVNGYTVPRSDGAMPLMTLPEELPDDIDYDWYVGEAKAMLEGVGYDV